MKKKYQKVLNFYNQVNKKKTGEHVLKNKLNEYLSFLKKGSRIIDIGCGPGHDVNYFINKGYNAVGVDFSKEFIEGARKKYHAEFYVADALRSDFFKKFKFDNVWISAVLMHFAEEDRNKFISNLNKAMKVGGYLSMILPKKRKKDVWQDKWRQYGGILDTFSKREAIKIIDEANFQLIIFKEFQYSKRPWWFIITKKESL